MVNFLYTATVILLINVIVVILFNPFFGLYLFTYLLYLKPEVFGSVCDSLHITRVIAFSTLIALFLNAGKKGEIKFFNDIQSRWLIVLGIVMCLSVATSIWRGNTIDFLADFIKIYVAYFLIINLVSSLRRYRAVVWAMIASMAGIGLFSIKAYYASGGLLSGDRMFGAFSGALFSDPNDMAMGFIMLLPFLYYDLFRDNLILRKVVLLATIGLFLWGIVLTQSRGGFIGMGAMLIVLWLRSRRKVMFAILGIFILGLAWPLTPHSFRDRMLSIRTSATDDNAAISRVDAWKAGGNMMKHRIFGVGAGNFGEGFVLYRPPDAVDVPGMRRVAHNMFIQVGGETGFAGFAIFILMIGSSLTSLNRTKKNILKEGDTKKEERREILLLADATFLSLIGYCASGMFLAQSYNFVLYYLIGFSVVLKRLAFSDMDAERIKVRKA
jgi:probable O-glycosylation ligase (exosortase A-associated)